MAEIWKDIPNYNGYQVSNYGRVRTHNKITYSKKHGERHWEDRILKYKNQSPKCAYATGYRVDLWKDKKPHTLLVARLVAFTFYGEDINNHNLTVNHKDGNRLNNDLHNLELISLADNIRHAFNTGLMPTNKKTVLINKKTRERHVVNSMTKASQFLGRCDSYVSGCILHNRKINDTAKNEYLYVIN